MQPPLKILFWVVWCVGVSSTFAAAAAASRLNCRYDQFECRNSEKCIKSFDTCDGKKDCSDGSDETFVLCSAFGANCRSSPYAFLCAYGACIDKSKACDGIKFDCADNSDELGCPNDHKEPSDPPTVISRCKKWEFSCKSGNCVNITVVCDGTADCDDKSDESIAECRDMSCPSYSFQCAYGGCIDWTKKCDNVTYDCADNSDEDPYLCPKDDTPGNTTVSTDSSAATNTCPFPRHEHTIYTPICRSCLPGTPLTKDQVVIPSCPTGYALPHEFKAKSKAYMVCLKPPKLFPTIQCEKMCPPLISEFHDMTCKSKVGKPVPCDEMANPGTVAHIECKPHFIPRYDISGVSETTCKADGNWTYNLYKCIPDCGKRPVDTSDEKINFGRNAVLGQAPWYVGFWQMENGIYNHFCGGTLIAPNLVISAAHCFSHFQQRDINGNIKDVKDIQVAAGKLHSNWNVHEKYEQKVGIRTIKERKGYIGDPGYEKDIAVVELLHNLKFNNFTLPACVDWKGRGSFETGEMGDIVGFGRTENLPTSETLQAASIYYISHDDCRVRNYIVQKEAQKEIMWDQICGGLDVSLNGQRIPSVDTGDSGGGFTFERNRKHYLIGVLSHHMNAVNSHAVYTSVNAHVKWLIDNRFAGIYV